MNDTGCPQQLELFEVNRQQVTVTFDGEQIVSDAGMMPIRQLDQKLGVLAEAARRLPDPRSQLFITHSEERIITQHVYQILAGYSPSLPVLDRRKIDFDQLCKLRLGESVSFTGFFDVLLGEYLQGWQLTLCGVPGCCISRILFNYRQRVFLPARIAVIHHSTPSLGSDSDCFPWEVPSTDIYGLASKTGKSEIFSRIVSQASFLFCISSPDHSGSSASDGEHCEESLFLDRLLIPLDGGFDQVIAYRITPAERKHQACTVVSSEYRLQAVPS